MAGINEIDKAVQTLLKLGIKVTKLWENASPASAFAAQEVTVDALTADYDFILYFSYYSKTDTDIIEWAMAKVGEKIVSRALVTAQYSNNGYATRVVSFSPGKIAFEDAYLKSIQSTAAGTKNNDRNTPAVVYAAKILSGGGY